jgi:two-component system, chemotaxis family, chemotaxis protein CheY
MVLSRRVARPKKILVVDDDPNWREYARLCLEDLGYDVLEAADGAQALQSLETADCSVVLLDLYMPGVDGFEVATKLPGAVANRAPKVVFVTSATAQDARDALRSGPHYYLPKGASREELSLLLSSLAS